MPIRYPKAHDYGLALMGQQQGPVAPNVLGALSTAAPMIAQALMMKQQKAEAADYGSGLLGFQQGVQNELLPSGVNATPPVQLGEDPSMRDYSNVIQKSSQGDAMAAALMGVTNPDARRDLQPMVMQQQMADISKADDRAFRMSERQGDQRFAQSERAATQDYQTAGREDTQAFAAGQSATAQASAQAIAEANRQAEMDRANRAMTPEQLAQQTQIRSAGRPQTNVSVNAAGNDFAKGLGGGASDILKEVSTGARGAVASITNGNKIREALASGNVIAGPTASWGVFARQVFGTDQEGLEATRTVIQGLAESTLSARQLLKGQGAITDREGALLEKARSGDIDGLTIPEINIIVDTNERLARAQIKQNKGFVDRAKAIPGAPADFISMFDVDEPPAYQGAQKPAPQGGGPVRVASPEEAMKLPPGTPFTTPDGRVKVR